MITPSAISKLAIHILRFIMRPLGPPLTSLAYQHWTEHRCHLNRRTCVPCLAAAALGSPGPPRIVHQDTGAAPATRLVVDRMSMLVADYPCLPPLGVHQTQSPSQRGSGARSGSR